MNKSRKFATIISHILFFSALFFHAKAQNPNSYYVEEPKLFQGGVVGGINVCQVDGDKYAGFFKVGINAGAILYTRLNNSFAVSLELLYSQKGASSNFRQNSSSGQFTIVKQRINLNYAEIPIMLNLFDRKKSHVGVGLSYSQLIFGDEEITTSPANAYDPALYPFKKQDLNFIVGGNLHLVAGLYGNIRFQYSILPIRDKVDFEYARAKQYNNLWTIRVMYLF